MTTDRVTGRKTTTSPEVVNRSLLAPEAECWRFARANAQVGRGRSGLGHPRGCGHAPRSCSARSGSLRRRRNENGPLGRSIASQQPVQTLAGVANDLGRPLEVSDRPGRGDLARRELEAVELIS